VRPPVEQKYGAPTGSPLVIGVEDTEDSKSKDGRRWSINRNTTWLVIEQA